MAIDLIKVKRLANAIQSAQVAKFKAQDTSVSMDPIQYIGDKDAAALLAAELNRAIEPIVVKLEKQLRTEMAKASKD